MSFSIVKPGLQDTVQDEGRYGYGRWGINPGGAMDRYAAALANMLTGNPACSALLEMHFPGPQILFEQNALVSITGADFSAALNDEPLPMWQPVVVRKNTILHFTALLKGARCYLAVHGGICVKSWLKSYSTNLKAAVGGYHGRRLLKGDEIRFGESTVYFAGLLKEGKDYKTLGWRPDTTAVYQYPNEIFFTEGREFDLLTPTSQQNLQQENFMIHPSSDRMGYQLKGEPLHLVKQTELVSTGVSFGTIQLLPNGQLVVLMADHQTTGGYPRIGHVISAHLPKLAQLRPSDTVAFKRVTIGKAEELLFSQQHDLVILQRACEENLNQLVC
jgi:antagonist of KipI